MNMEKQNQTEVNAEKVEVMDSTAKIIDLKRPAQFDGQTLKTIVLDFERLTGADIEEAEMQFTAENPQNAATTPLKEMSKAFCAIVAAKASKKPVEFIRNLGAADYAKVTTQVSVFLMSGE